MLSSAAIEALLALRERLFAAIGRELARGGTSKSYEGLFEIQLSRHGEQPSVTLVLHCYAIGPARHHAWRGLTLDDCVRIAEEDIAAWIAEADAEAAEDPAVSASIFPLQEMMLICGCGGERLVPQHELEQIRSVEDFDRFVKGRIALYSCRCGAAKCDIRMLPNEAAHAELAEMREKEERQR